MSQFKVACMIILFGFSRHSCFLQTIVSYKCEILSSLSPIKCASYDVICITSHQYINHKIRPRFTVHLIYYTFYILQISMKSLERANQNALLQWHQLHTLERTFLNVVFFAKKSFRQSREFYIISTGSMEKAGKCLHACVLKLAALNRKWKSS